MNNQATEACQECMAECQKVTNDPKMKATNDGFAKCCVECFQICDACVRAIARDSGYAEEYCNLCAEICDACAKLCDAHDCTACAEACRKCVECVEAA